MGNIKKAEAMILRDFALNGSAIGYMISKRTGLSLKTAYTSSKDLVDKGLLSVSIVGKTRAKQDMKEYSLMLLGVVEAFPFARPEEWSSIIERWSALAPDVFGKWDFFMSAGVEDLAIWKLKLAGIARITGTPFVPHCLPLELAMSESMVLEFFCTNFYHPEVGLYNDEARDRWIEACRKDEEIPKWLIRILIKSLIHHYTGIKNTKRMLSTLQDKDKGKTVLTELLEDDDLFIFARQ